MSTVVLEIGSCFVRIGIAGEYSPRVVAPIESEFAANSPRIFIQTILSRWFIDWLRIKPKECRLLIIEDIVFNISLRKVIYEICALDFQFVSVSMQPNLFLVALAADVNDCVIVDIGDSLSRVIAVSNSRPILNTLTFANTGVKKCLEEFSLNMKELGYTIQSRNSRLLFEQSSRLRNDYNLTPNFNQVPASSSQITVPIEISESSLLPLILGLSRVHGIIDDNGGIVGSLLKCIHVCNVDLRAKVAQNIVIVGGGACIPGLPNAVCKEATKNMANNSTINQVLSKLPSSQFTPAIQSFPLNNIAWVGGSLFSSIQENDSKFITSREIMSRASVNVDVRPPDWLSISELDWIFFGPAPLTNQQAISEREKRKTASEASAKQSKPVNITRRSSALARST